MNILATGAHFDDVELGCGATLAKHAQNGDNVIIYVPTLSGYADYAKKVIRDNTVALKEGQAAAEIIGATLIRDDFPTMRLEFVDELNAKLVQIVEENDIDILYTHWYGDIHHDHQALSKASMHAGRHVKRILMYRSNWYHSPYDFRGNFYVDVTDYWHIKEAAIMAHESEFERVGEKWLNFFRNESMNAGQKIGVSLAEPFEPVKWLA